MRRETRKRIKLIGALLLNATYRTYETFGLALTSPMSPIRRIHLQPVRALRNWHAEMPTGLSCPCSRLTPPRPAALLVVPRARLALDHLTTTQ